MSVFKDIKILDKNLLGFSRTYKENRELAHDLAVSVMFHTAAHRQLDPKGRSDKLHRFYDILKKADQDAFRQWASALVTWKVAGADGKEVTKRWLSGSRDEAGIFTFTIIKGTEIQSKQFAEDIERIDSLPSFFDHEPSSRPAGFSFGETELLKAIKALVARAEKGNKETHQISDTVMSIVSSAKVMIESAVQSEKGKGRPLGTSEVPAAIVEPSTLSEGQKGAAKAVKAAKQGGKVIEEKIAA